MPKPKTNSQIQRMFGLGRPLGCGKDELEELAFDVTAGRTGRLSELTFDEANGVIVRLGGEAFPKYGQSKRMENHRKQEAGIKTIETDAQLKLIDELAAMRSWSAETLAKFCQRVIKRDAPTTTEEGNKIVEGLKAMNARDGLLAFPKPPLQKPARSKGTAREPRFRRVA